MRQVVLDTETTGLNPAGGASHYRNWLCGDDRSTTDAQ